MSIPVDELKVQEEQGFDKLRDYLKSSPKRIKCPECGSLCLGKGKDGKGRKVQRCPSCGNQFTLGVLKRKDRLPDELCPKCGGPTQRQGTMGGKPRYYCPQCHFKFISPKSSHKKKPAAYCIFCGSPVYKAGKDNRGVQTYRCRDSNCGRYFTDRKQAEELKRKKGVVFCPRCKRRAKKSGRDLQGQKYHCKSCGYNFYKKAAAL